LSQLSSHEQKPGHAQVVARRGIASLSGARALLLVILGVGAALRFSTLSLQSFDLDESVTVALLHQGFHGMLSSIPTTESTPPLYYVLAWLWAKPFGLDEVGLRSFSALLGTMMIPIAYCSAKRLISSSAGLVAAALTAFSPWLVWYSQEARAYALLALLTLASFAFFLRAMDAPSRTNLAGWAVLSALSLTTHYFALFMVLPEAAWLLARGQPRWRAAIATAFVGAVGLALLPLALQQAHDVKAKAGFLQTPLLSRVGSIPARFLLGEAPPPGAKLLLLTLCVGLAVGGGALLLLRSSDGIHGARARIALSLGASALAIPLVLAVLGRDYLDARNLIGAWVPLGFVLAAGCASAPRLGLPAMSGLLIVFCVVLLLGDLDQNLQRTDYRGAVAALGPSPGAGQRAIVITPHFNWTPFTFYLPGYPSISSGNVGVREIDLVGWRSSRLRRESVDYLARRGFHLTEDRALQKLRLARFVAAEVTSVSRAQLASSRLGSSGATVLIQSGR
jgi:mannosyltransferase